MVFLHSILKPKKKSTQWLHEVNSQEVELTLSNQSIIEQCHSIGLSLQDLKIAKTIQILIKENANTIASVYFKGMSHIPGYTSIIQKFSNEERWIEIHARSLVLMFAGQFNDSHFNKLQQLARNHQSIGVQPQWYVASFQILQEGILETIYEATENKEEYYIISKSVTKVLNIPS